MSNVGAPQNFGCTLKNLGVPWKNWVYPLRKLSPQQEEEQEEEQEQ